MIGFDDWYEALINFYHWAEERRIDDKMWKRMFKEFVKYHEGIHQHYDTNSEKLIGLPAETERRVLMLTGPHHRAIIAAWVQMYRVLE